MCTPLEQGSLVRTIKVVIAAIGAFALGSCAGTDADSGGDGFQPDAVEMVIPFNPGGGMDLAGRTIAAALQDVEAVDSNIQISNLPGGSGAVGMNKMGADYKGDPNKLLTVATHVLLTPIQQGTEYDSDQMTPLARMYSEYQLVVVREDSPLQNAEDLSEALQADPQSLILGGGSAGSIDQVLTSAIAEDIGINPSDLKYVPYDGGDSVPAVLGGNLDVAFGGFDLLDLVEAGDLRAIAVSSPDPLGGRLAEIPTLREQGIDVELANWRGVFGPADMPTDAVSYWRTALEEVSTNDEWQDFLETNAFVSDFESDGFAEFLTDQDTTFRTLLDTESNS